MVHIFYAQFRKYRPRLQVIGWQSLQSGKILPVGRNPNVDGSWALNLLCNRYDASKFMESSMNPSIFLMPILNSNLHKMPESNGFCLIL